jgi:hypothetical protein
MHCMMPVRELPHFLSFVPFSSNRIPSCAARAIELNPKYAKAYYRCVSYTSGYLCENIV